MQNRCHIRMEKFVELMISIMPKMDALFLVVEYWKSEQQDKQ